MMRGNLCRPRQAAGAAVASEWGRCLRSGRCHTEGGTPMSSDTADERTGDAPAEAEASQHLGVLATYRQTPLAAKPLPAGVFVSRLAGFLQIFLVLFLTHRGFSEGQAGLALGMYGA